MTPREMAIAEAQRAGIDPELFLRLVMQESGFRDGQVSPKGAVGYTQVMPATAMDPGYGVTPMSDMDDPREQFRFGADYLSAMFNEFDGDQDMALAAYNAGPGAVRQHGGIPPYRETMEYVNTVGGGPRRQAGLGMPPSMGAGIADDMRGTPFAPPDRPEWMGKVDSFMQNRMGVPSTDEGRDRFERASKLMGYGARMMR